MVDAERQEERNGKGTWELPPLYKLADQPSFPVFLAS
jgi:hypothetical protein